MGYIGRRYYRSWRVRGYGSSKPSKYKTLVDLFGGALYEIRNAFLSLDEDALDELLSDYGSIHGDSAEKYARKIFPNWKSGSTKLSGQTMERLVELVPPYLTAKHRFSLLQIVLKKHKKSGINRTIKINVKEPSSGFQELNNALTMMSHNDVLAHLPEKVMKAASWLYDDDITAARAMLAQAEKLENDIVRVNASREIELLQRTISTGQIRSATYSVEMPVGILNVVAFTPSKCFVASVCFGEDAFETQVLRQWRDSFLIERKYGRMFIVWYYENGEMLADFAKRHIVIKVILKFSIGIFARTVAYLRGTK